MTERDRGQAADVDGAPENALFIRFIGRLLGLLSHELNNHLAILRESIGLADDILSARKMPEKKRLDDVTALVRSLDEKLNRPIAIVRHVGDLSLQIEQDATDHEADLMVDRLLSLIQRMAIQRKIIIRKSLAGHSLRLSVDPLLMQFLLFALLDNLYSALDSGGRVTIDTARKGKDYSIHITSEQTPRTMPENEPWPQKALFDTVRRTGGTLHYGEGGGTITLTFPVTESR